MSIADENQDLVGGPPAPLWARGTGILEQLPPCGASPSQITIRSSTVTGPVVELRRLRGRVPRNLLGVLEASPVREVRRDPRRPERVAAGRGRELRGSGPPL